MKTIKILTMAALALLTAACTNDDNDLTTPQPQQQAEGIPFSATITVDNTATTRALAESGTTIEATWADGEKVALIYDAGGTSAKTEAEVTKQTDGTATISATLQSGAVDGSAVTIIYPATAADGTTGNVKTDLLAAQDGTLTGTSGTSIAEKYDVRKGTGKLSINGTATVNNGTAGTPVTLTNQNSIFKFTLKDIAGTSDKAATEFIVKDGSNNVLTTVTPASAMNELYVALPALAVGTYWFNATVGGKPYIAKATVSTATTAGNYYQTQVNMATLGDLMAANGKFYADAAAITAASTTAIGVIAYLGTDNFTENGTTVGGNTFAGHGLVLCLKNAASGTEAQWSTEKRTLELGDDAKVINVGGLKRTTSVSGYTNTKTLAEKTDAATKYKAAYAAKNYTGLTAPAGTTGWFLPSAQQWVKMQEGLGGLAESAIVWGSFNNDHSAAIAWETAMAKAGTKGTAYDSMTDAYLWYWSSSENSADYAVSLGVEATNTSGDYGFYWFKFDKDSTGDRRRVRPVLAF